MPVGKLSFENSKIEENIRVYWSSAKPQVSKSVYIKSLTVSGTMTPSVKLDMGLTR